MIILHVHSSKEGEVISKEKMGEFRLRYADFNQVPTSKIERILDSSAKSLNAKNKKVWRHGVALSDTSNGMEGLSFPTINEHLDRGSGDTGYDEV